MAVSSLTMAADITGPWLVTIEEFIADVISFTVLGSVKTGRAFGWLPRQTTVTDIFGGLLVLLGLPFAIEAYFRPSEDYQPKRLVTVAPFLVLAVSMSVVVISICAVALSLILVLVYLIFLALDVVMWTLTAPYRFGIWMRRRFHWAHPIRTLVSFYLLLVH
jgi:hypothetical protein